MVRSPLVVLQIVPRRIMAKSELAAFKIRTGGKATPTGTAKASPQLRYLSE
jgi:hypothetical protein